MARLTALMTRPYKYLRLEWSAELAALRVRTFVKPIQCYSLAGLTEMQRVLDDIAENPGLVRHLVLTSDVTGEPEVQPAPNLIRPMLESAIERLIAILDEISPDPDLESDPGPGPAHVPLRRRLPQRM